MKTFEASDRESGLLESDPSLGLGLARSCPERFPLQTRPPKPRSSSGPGRKANSPASLTSRLAAATVRFEGQRGGAAHVLSMPAKLPLSPQMPWPDSVLVTLWGSASMHFLPAPT